MPLAPLLAYSRRSEYLPRPRTVCTQAWMGPGPTRHHLPSLGHGGCIVPIPPGLECLCLPSMSTQLQNIQLRETCWGLRADTGWGNRSKPYTQPPAPFTVRNVGVPDPGTGHSGPWNGAAMWESAPRGSVGLHSSLPRVPSFFFSAIRRKATVPLPKRCPLLLCLGSHRSQPYMTSFHLSKPSHPCEISALIAGLESDHHHF